MPHVVASWPRFVEAKPNNPKDSQALTDSVTIDFRIFGDAAKDVDYSVSTYNITLAPFQDQTDIDDIIIRALQGQYRGEDDRQLAIGGEVTSINSDDPNVTYRYEQVTSQTVLGFNWNAGYVEQLGSPPTANPIQVLPDCPTTCPAAGPGDSGKFNTPVPFFSGQGVTKSGGGGQFSSHPVRYFDGAALVSSTDLSSGANGMPWGVTREWTNAPGFDRVGFFGEGVVTAERPYLLALGQTNPQSTIAVVTNGHTAFYFDLNSGVYVPHGYIQDQLEYDSGNDEFVYTDSTGAQFRFYDFSASLYSHQQGQLKTYVSRGGDATAITLAYDSNNGVLKTVERASTVNGLTITEQFAYSYLTSGSNAGLIASIKLQRKEGTNPSDPFVTVREAVYDYYDGAEPYGNIFNLKTVAIRDADEHVLDTTYYRYYTQDDIDNQEPGYVNGLKYVFYPRSFARLKEFGESLSPQKTPFQLTDDQVEEFADHYFQYDEERRVSLEVAQGAGCSACTGGLGTFEYGYFDRRGQFGYEDGTNSWAMKTTETLPDGNETIVYSNYLGQVMLKVFRDTTTQMEWATFYRYDDEGRVVFVAQPSAVSGYDEATPYLMDEEANSNPSSPGSFDYLRDSAGLITEYAYYNTTNLTYGYVAGYLEQTAIHEGESGTWIVQSRQTYTSRTVDSTTIYPIASQTVYENENTTGALTTSYAYTYHSGKLQPESIATTDPASGVTTVFYDFYGRATWLKDADGFIQYVAYDQATGAVSQTIVDVNTSSITGEPSGWSTPSGGGLHLTTTHTIDSLGRPTKTVDANSDVTHYLYNDVARETRVYPGWNGSTGTTTGPTMVIRDDRDHGNGYTEMLTTSAAPTASGSSPNLVPTGNQAINTANPQSLNLHSLRRTYFNAAGQSTSTRDYFSFASLSYGDAADLGTLNSGSGTTGNYYQTDVAFDSRGRVNRIQRGDGTIYRTVYDGLGRLKSEWIGTSDTVPQNTFWSDTNYGQMVRTTLYKYDQNGTTTETDDIGDSHLTSIIETVGWSPTLVTRTTTLEYDFRGRVETKTLPDPGAATHEVSPVYRYEYDNLNRVIKDTDGIDGDLTTLGRYSTYDYDDANRTVTMIGRDADGSSGTTTDRPTTVITYNARRLQATFEDAMDRATTYQYDGASRLSKVISPDPNASDSNPAPETEYEFDGLGNVRFVIDPLGHETEYQYDDAARLTHTIQPDPDSPGSGLPAPVVEYQYDAGGRRYKLIDPASNETTWLFDALGRVTQETNELSKSRFFQYDGANRLAKKTDRNGRITRYEYNKYDQLTFERWYESNDTTLVRTISLAYDEARQMTAADEPTAASYDYVYDLLGRLTDETQDILGLANDPSYDSKYDQNGFRFELAATIGTTADFKNTYTPDNLQRLKSLVQEGVSGGNAVAGKQFTFDYNNAGQFTKISRYANASATQHAVSSHYLYDGLGRLTQLTHSNSTSAPSLGSFGSSAISGHRYEWDDASRVAERTSLWRTSTSTQFEGTTVYAHDNTNQLTAENPDWQADASYTYDESGNREQYQSGTFVRDYTNDDPNRITSDGWFTFTHDDEGNVASKGNSNVKYEYDWDWRNRLTAVRLYINWGSGLSLYWTMTYGYDAFNRLVRRSIDTDGPSGYAPVDGFYSHENGQIVLEFGQYSYGSLTNRYVWGPQTDLLLVNEFNSASYGAGKIYYGLGDLVNTVHDSAKYNSSTGLSAVITHRYIDAFGAAGSYLTFDGTSYSGGPFIYTGRFRDDMTGLQWNLHRWYDTYTARWMSEDPIGFLGGDYNLYRYVGNSPLTATDPRGLAGDSVSVAIERCLGLPFPENVRCLNDLLGSGYKDQQIRIVQCELVYGAYKVAGASCRKCDPTMTKSQLLANAACFSAEVVIRARYLSMNCDCVLPLSIARGSAKARAGHTQELAQKSAAASRCYALAAIAKR